MDKERLFRNLERKYSSKCELAVNIPLGVDPDVIWEEVLQSRKAKSIPLPLYNVNGEAYWYLLTNKMISASEVIVEEFAERDTELQPHLSSVATIEEIYFTGFMEGAQISVQDAMSFLQSGEEPSNVEELILLNNRQAAGFAAENMYHAIDSNYLHNLAYFLTEGLDNGSGDYRITDNIEIPSLQGEVVKLPTANAIPALVNQLAAFLADTKTHPLIKAAVAQAWILAIRPFPEGNERLARLLSSVILIRAGYSFFGECSISSVIAKSSYEYFRAISNILRTENGADMTYFLEYYMTVLSGTVNELKNRRERQDEGVIEEEQRMAALPLTTTHSAGSDPTQNIDQRNAYDRISAALKDLRMQGVQQFTVSDIKSLTGLSRKHLYTMLAKFVQESQITIIGKSKSGNIYTFVSEDLYTDSAADDDLSQPYEYNATAEVDLPKAETDGSELLLSEDNEDTADSYAKVIYTKDQIADILQNRMMEKNENYAAIAGQLLTYLQNGKETFTAVEISDSLKLHIAIIRGSMRWCRKNGIVKIVAKAGKKTYSYAFNIESHVFASANEPPDEKSIVLFDKLNTLQSNTDEKTSLFAYIFLRFLYAGKRVFTTADLAEQAEEFHLENYEIHNALRAFRRMQIIENINAYGTFGTYQFVLPDADEVHDDEVAADYTTETEESFHTPDSYTTVMNAIDSRINNAKSRPNSIKVSRLLKRFLNNRKYEFSTAEIAGKLGLSVFAVRNVLMWYKRENIISIISDNAHNYIYGFNVERADDNNRGVQSYADEYSEEVMELVTALINAEKSQKDRRIGQMIFDCMDKGEITTEDYENIHAEGKMYADMRFAEHLGLVKRIGPGQYEIRHTFDDFKMKIDGAMKNTVTMLYDIFGEDAFSVEMAVAKLDYSESHMCATLHQLSLMKILEGTRTEGNRLSYQLLVNPSDNPELFDSAA